MRRAARTRAAVVYDMATANLKIKPSYIFQVNIARRGQWEFLSVLWECEVSCGHGCGQSSVARKGVFRMLYDVELTGHVSGPAPHAREIKKPTSLLPENHR